MEFSEDLVTARKRLKEVEETKKVDLDGQLELLSVIKAYTGLESLEVAQRSAVKWTVATRTAARHVITDMQSANALYMY